METCLLIFIEFLFDILICSCHNGLDIVLDILSCGQLDNLTYECQMNGPNLRQVEDPLQKKNNFGTRTQNDLALNNIGLKCPVRYIGEIASHS